ncbi:MAG: enoyl-CoA hydratase-related protein [bacterium]|nr:enoyl-CoA hydratase-related protein [bacterium]MDE0288912.1 enoyl-CoA hydratase-related protein [bacterium]MDE0437527.1 enoyl-CoA hydratase-related protein [bacterium]
MDYEFLIFSRDDAVATITLDRPDVMNALSQRLERELHHALDETDSDPTARAIALRMGVVNEVVPAEELLDRAHALARRIAMVPADSVRLNKAITTYGLEAMGLRNAHNVMAFLATIAHSSGDSPEVRHLDEAFRRGGIRAFLDARDGPFQPEPVGPRSPRDT